MTSIGIHHVAVAQNNSVKPIKNGKTSRNNGDSGAAAINNAPASVEIATAPTLIQ